MHVTRIAMCQIVCLDGDRRGNFARIEHAVREARKAGAQVACLPETVIYGWVNPDAHRRAHPIPGEDSWRLCDLARENGLHLCVGLEEKDGEQLYDSALLIDDGGRILLKHRKLNLLEWLMTPPYSPGETIEVTETRFGRVGVLICADTHVETHLHRMAALQPDVVLVPYGYAAQETAWPGHGTELERVVMTAARTIGAPVVGTNLVGQITHGPWTGWTYGGHSVAADRAGRLVAIGKDFDRDIRMIDLER
jgi:predicted amidohydrolase